MAFEIASQLVDEAFEQSRGCDDPAVLCGQLRDSRELRKALGIFEGDLTQRIAKLIGRRQEIDGLGVVEVKYGKDRKAWDHDELTRVVVARALDERVLDEETGVYEQEGHAVARVLRDCAGFSYWRVTALKARGIDPDEYCESSPGLPSVILP